jgi:hypothetical protein
MIYESQVSCEVNPEASRNLYNTLDLAFGISDSSSCPIESPITFYVNGKAIWKRALVPGRLQQIRLNVSGVRSISIDLQGPNCSSSGAVHFVNATLR